ncbi:MAG: amidohydrolase family protein [Thermodesulfobacteriota bacterium]
MILDFHTHIFPAFFTRQRERFFPEEPDFELLYRPPGSRMADCGELLRAMDEEGVERSVVFGFPWQHAEFFRRHNDYILESVQKHPGRLVGFCAFSPDSPAALREAERCLGAGLSGVGEIAFYHKGLSERSTRRLGELVEICAPFNAPLLIHTNEPVGHAYPGKTPVSLGALYHLIRKHPGQRFILAHWGGGLFFYALMKKEVREALGNTWFDTAASPFLYKPEVYRIAGGIVGFEKILFGSDFPLLRPGRYFREMESAGVPPEAVNRIRGDNAARLLGLA